MTVQIAQDHGVQKFAEQFEKMLTTLDAIKAEFSKSSPSKSKVNQLLGSLVFRIRSQVNMCHGILREGLHGQSRSADRGQRGGSA